MSKSKKICVYTCITGDYDDLHEVEIIEKNVDYLCFTNNKKLKSNTWKIIYIEDEKLDNQRLSRKIKMLGHPYILEHYEISVWMDASVIFKSSINDFVKKYFDSKKAPFSAFVHHSRNCIYEEANACIKARKDTRENIERHINFLKQENYPKNNGLYEMTVFIKEHNNPIVKETMRLWFQMICNYSKRDQLSFMYCVWKTGMKVNPIFLNVWDNKYFIWIKHNFAKEINYCKIMFCKEEEYNYKYDIDCSYQIEGNRYVIDVKVPCKTNYIKIELFNTPCVIYKNLKINQIAEENINIINSIKYNENDIFYNDIPIIEINKKFMENDSLHMEVEYYKMTIDEIYNFVDYLGYNYKIQLDNNYILSNKLNIQEKKNNELNATLNSITSSRGWKLLEKLREFKIRLKDK